MWDNPLTLPLSPWGGEGEGEGKLFYKILGNWQYSYG